MEMLIILIYAGILALVAPFVLPPSEHYGKFVPAGLAVTSGAALWLVFTWLGFHYDEAWIWFIVMLGMPAAAWFGTKALDARRQDAEAKEFESLKLGS
jgi:Flp pilus assembly protein TadB